MQKFEGKNSPSRNIIYISFIGKKSKYNVLNIVKMIKQIVNINISLLSIHYLKIIRYERNVYDISKSKFSFHHFWGNTIIQNSHFLTFSSIFHSSFLGY
jgi:hypothetical protein